MCDKLEANIQAKIYDEKGYGDIHNPNNKTLLKDQRIIDLMNKGAISISDLFLIHDLPKLKKEFIDISHFVRNNKITDLGKID